MINILPYKYKKNVHRLRILRIATTTIWMLILLVGVAGLLLLPLLITIDSRFAIVQKQILMLEKSGAVINPVDVVSLQSRATVLLSKLATPMPPAPTEYVALARSSDKAGVILSGFSMESGASPILELSGVASNRESLQKFIAVLEKDERVLKVESPVSNFVKSNNSPFRLRVTFK